MRIHHMSCLDKHHTKVSRRVSENAKLSMNFYCMSYMFLKHRDMCSCRIILSEIKYISKADFSSSSKCYLFTRTEK